MFCKLVTCLCEDGELGDDAEVAPSVLSLALLDIVLGPGDFDCEDEVEGCFVGPFILLASAGASGLFEWCDAMRVGLPSTLVFVAAMPLASTFPRALGLG